MAQATYEIKLDTGRDGTFGASIDDITAYVLNASWNNGMAASYDEVAEPARLQLVIDNIDGNFNPDTLGADLVTNGNFSSWTADNPNSWTVTGESGSNPEVEQASKGNAHGEGGTGACNIYSTSSAVSISQTILTVGQTYKVTIDVTNAKSGSIAIYTGTTLVTPPMSVAKAYTFYFNADSTSFKIQSFSYTCDITIDNVTVQQTSLYGPLLQKGTLVRVRATYSATTYTMYIGKLNKATPQPGTSYARQLTLMCEDPMRELLDANYKPPLLTDTTVDLAIADVFDTAVLAYPYKHSYWMVGVAGASELGSTTILYQVASYTFDTGNTTLAFTGDLQTDGQGNENSNAGTSPQAFIREMMAAEVGGRFWFDSRTNTFILHNRHRDITNTTVDEALTENDFEGDYTEYTYGDDVVNTYNINYTPREVGAANTVIWQASNLPFTLAPGQEWKTTARYQDPDNPGVKVAAQDIVPIETNVDFQATFQGTNSPQRVARTFKFGATSADIYLKNVSDTGSGGEPRTVSITALQIRGTPILTYDQKQVTATNGDSVYQTQQRSQTVNINAISDDDFAQSVADYRVALLGQQLARFPFIGFVANSDDTRMARTFTRLIGDRITVSDSWLGHSADYFIVGERHAVTFGADNNHIVTWILKPASRLTVWVLGVTGFTELGETTRLAL